jgi:hopanoid C-3 methylase
VRILLVQPEFRSGSIGFRLAALPEPLALELLAAMVPDHEVALLDMRLEADLTAALEQFAPDVVAVTALTTEVYAAQNVLATAKAWAKEIFTVAGGHHATLLPEDFQLPTVDAICLGQGELVFPALIEALAAKRTLQHVPNLVWRDGDGHFVRNGRTPAQLDMDAIPVPRRDLVAKYRPHYFWLFNRPDSSVATGRGCPYRCNFCSVWEFYGGQYAQMSADRVLAELRTVETAHLTFVDDNFMLNHRRDAFLAQAIKAEGISHSYSMECRTDTIARHPKLVEQWVDVGLYGMLLGLEGASDQTLRRVNKNNQAHANDEAVRILRANGVITWAAFLVDPDWSVDDFQALREYVTRMDIGFMQFTVLTPLPGTQLYREKRQELLTGDYRCYDTLHAVVPTRLPREEFYRQFAMLYQQPRFAPYYDLINRGKLSMDDCRRGYEMVQNMCRWEHYLENDPVLGKREPLPAPDAA